MPGRGGQREAEQGWEGTLVLVRCGCNEKYGGKCSVRDGDIVTASNEG